MVPLIKKLDQGIRKKYGHRVDWVNGEGYDAALLLFDALKRAKLNPENIKSARKSIQEALVSTKGFIGTLAMGDMSPVHELPLPIIMVRVDQNKKFISAD